jgi:hypothetical protein
MPRAGRQRCTRERKAVLLQRAVIGYYAAAAMLAVLAFL